MNNKTIKLLALAGIFAISAQPVSAGFWDFWYKPVETVSSFVTEHPYVAVGLSALGALWCINAFSWADEENEQEEAKEIICEAQSDFETEKTRKDLEGLEAFKQYLNDTTIDLKKIVNKIEPGSRMSLLLSAISEENCLLVSYLLEEGADPNLSDNNGCTPLIAAASKLNTELVKLLLDANAYSSAQDKDGKNAFNHAVTSKKEGLQKACDDKDKKDIEQRYCQIKQLLWNAVVKERKNC